MEGKMSQDRNDRIQHDPIIELVFRAELKALQLLRDHSHGKVYISFPESDTLPSELDVMWSEEPPTDLDYVEYCRNLDDRPTTSAIANIISQHYGVAIEERLILDGRSVAPIIDDHAIGAKPTQPMHQRSNGKNLVGIRVSTEDVKIVSTRRPKTIDSFYPAKHTVDIDGTVGVVDDLIEAVRDAFARLLSESDYQGRFMHAASVHQREIEQIASLRAGNPDFHGLTISREGVVQDVDEFRYDHAHNVRRAIAELPSHYLIFPREGNPLEPIRIEVTRDRPRPEDFGSPCRVVKITGRDIATTRLDNDFARRIAELFRYTPIKISEGFRSAPHLELQR
jgi:hypothetical protein